MRRRRALFAAVVLGALAVPAPALAAGVTSIEMYAFDTGTGGVFGQVNISRAPGASGVVLSLEGSEDAIVPVRFIDGDSADLDLTQAAPVDLDEPFTLGVTASGGFAWSKAFPSGFTVRPDGDDGIVRGTAPPGATVTVSQFLGASVVVPSVPANGQFTVDLRDDGFVGPYHLFESIDLELELVGPDGMTVYMRNSWGLPGFYVNTINGDRTATDLFAFALTPGRPTTVNGVVMGGTYDGNAVADITDGLEVATQGRTFDVTIPPLGIDAVDLATDVATGFGPPNGSVLVGADTDLGFSGLTSVPTDASGAWTRDFSATGANTYARVFARLQNADRPDGISEVQDTRIVGVHGSAMEPPRTTLDLAPGASAPGDATFLLTISGDDEDVVSLRWTPTGGSPTPTIERTLDIPRADQGSATVRVVGSEFGRSFDPTDGGVLRIQTPEGTWNHTLPPMSVVVDGRDVVATTTPGITTYVSAGNQGQEFDGVNVVADGAGVARLANVRKAGAGLVAGRVAATLDSFVSRVYGGFNGGRVAVDAATDGGSVRIPSTGFREVPGLIRLGAGAPAGVQVVATGYEQDVPLGWHPGATPISSMEDFLGGFSGGGYAVTVTDASGELRVPPAPLDVVVPLLTTPQPGEEVFVGSWTPELGWEVVPSDDVTVCVATTSAACQGTFGMHVVARSPHASVFAAFVGDPTGGDLDIARADGQDRVETAILLSKAAFPDGADTVVVARADDFADALAAVPLAAAAGAPVLLNPVAELDGRVADEVARLGAAEVLVMGGPVAQSTAVVEALGEVPGVADVARRAGEDRFLTAGAIADDAVARWTAAGFGVAGSQVLVALGSHPDRNRAWPDALSAGQLAAAAKAPILLVTPSEVPAGTAASLSSIDPDLISVIGGPVAIPETVAAQLGDTAQRRLAGADRFETSLAVAEAAFAAGASDRELLVATGLNFPDGLAAGAVAARRQGLLVLVDGQAVAGSESVYEWLEARGGVTRWARVAGGPVAIVEAVLQAVEAALQP